MTKSYIEVLQNTTLGTLLNLPHKQRGAHPSGFVVRTDIPVEPFPFTLCPLYFCKTNEPLPGSNPHDVIVDYKEGNLEALLYTIWEQYAEDHLEKNSCSSKRYRLTGVLPPRKIVIPCLGRKENLIPTLKRLRTIHPPTEGYHPPICIVEHSPFPELEGIAKEQNAEYIWLFLDPRDPTLPLGQFNKALSYDKAFLFSSPAEWYLFHDNDILVPNDFWKKIDLNVERTKTKFLQPYTHRSLLNTLPDIAERFRQNISLADKPLHSEMFYPIIAGAPGGSLYLHRQRYIDVGGHDPNYCWGYGPEDLLFFKKLALLEDIAYADDPPIEMIHLWHPPAASRNPFRNDMDFFVKVFFEQKPREEKMQFLQEKKKILEQFLEQIQNSNFHTK